MGSVLIVDDDESILDVVELGLQMEGWMVQKARNGADALKTFRDAAPTAVVLDWSLPDMEGVEICRRMRDISNVPILMLTARNTLEDRVHGLDSGADDYLAKPFRMPELQARIRALMRRAGETPGNTLTYGILRLQRDTRVVTVQDRAVQLTAREFELLELLMTRPRHVVTREQILTRLWGFDYHGETRVVETHMRTLRQKLGDGQRRLIRSVRGVGYSLGG